MTKQGSGPLPMPKVTGCLLSSSALAASETQSGVQTAEMPGFYGGGEYDVAGFAVGAVKQDRVIDGKSIQEGDVLIGLPSSGPHSNGYSLVRKIVEVHPAQLHAWLPLLLQCRPAHA